LNIYLFPPIILKFITIQTEKGFQMKWGRSRAKAVAMFRITEDETVLVAYEYCNLHGLRMAKA